MAEEAEQKEGGFGVEEVGEKACGKGFAVGGGGSGSGGGLEHADAKIGEVGGSCELDGEEKMGGILKKPGDANDAVEDVDEKGGCYAEGGEKGRAAGSL